MFGSVRSSTAITVLTAGLLAATLGGCTSRDDRPGIGSVSLMNGSTLFARASAMKERKEYREAAQAFSLMAGWGRGWEVAQYQLGTCLLAMADAPGANDSPADLRREAFVWIKLAADSGIKLAQSRLALMLRDGIGIEPNLLAAATYATLAEQGSGDIPLIRSSTEANVATSLADRLTAEDWAEVRNRARNFAPIIQSVRQPTPGDRKAAPKPAAGT